MERLCGAPSTTRSCGRPLLTQPVAIAAVADFARKKTAVKYFDAGDVQANGFQMIEDEAVGDTFTDTGASYMGFAVSGILAAAVADAPRYPIAFTGDGSFMMCPQILLDAAAYGLRGMIVLFDNRRMAAISSLQHAQYGAEFRTDDGVEVDYPSMARSFAGVRVSRAARRAPSWRPPSRRPTRTKGFRSCMCAFTRARTSVADSEHMETGTSALGAKGFSAKSTKSVCEEEFDKNEIGPWPDWRAVMRVQAWPWP